MAAQTTAYGLLTNPKSKVGALLLLYYSAKLDQVVIVFV